MRTDRRSPRAVRSRLQTEFGEALRAMVLATPGAVAGVISDEEGDAIDYAHDPDEIDEIDVQLLAAQIGLSVLALEATYRRYRLRAPVVLLETPSYGLLAGTVATQFVVAMQMEARANVGRALHAFEKGRDALQGLLE